MAMGASAVQVGTAYLLCPECTTSEIHRAALQSEAVQHTALTNLFSGRPARGIVNRFMAELGPINNAVPDFPLASSAVAVLRSAAEQQGFGDFSPLWCGQKCSRLSGDSRRRAHQAIGVRLDSLRCCINRPLILIDMLTKAYILHG